MGFVFDSVTRSPSQLNAAVGPLVFTSISGAITVEDVDAMDARAAAARARFPRVAIITLVTKNTPMPDKATRERAAEATRRAEGGTLDVVVLTSGGLWASAARAVLTGIYLFSGKLDAHRVAGDLDEACRIVAKELPYDDDKVKAAAAAFSALLAA